MAAAGALIVLMFRTDYPRKFSSSAPELTTAFDDERAPGPHRAR